MALNFNSFGDEFKFNLVVRAALIKCMHQLGISSIEIGETILRDLVDKEIQLEIMQSHAHFGWEIRCPELAKAQKRKDPNKKQLPWKEEIDEVEITVEETQ